MPDYRRFIAYFYEYIDGSRQRNAGFVKAEQRGGVWRIALQLKGRRWPEEGLEIYGYREGKEEYSIERLVKGYPQRDCLIQKFQLPEEWTDREGKRFGELDGMWIPCGEKRYFLSQWGEGEAKTEKLRAAQERGRMKLPEERRIAPGKGAEPSEPKLPSEQEKSSEAAAAAGVQEKPSEAAARAGEQEKPSEAAAAAGVQERLTESGAMADEQGKERTEENQAQSEMGTGASGTELSEGRAEKGETSEAMTDGLTESRKEGLEGIGTKEAEGKAKPEKKQGAEQALDSELRESRRDAEEGHETEQVFPLRSERKPVWEDAVRLHREPQECLEDMKRVLDKKQMDFRKVESAAEDTVRDDKLLEQAEIPSSENDRTENRNAAQGRQEAEQNRQKSAQDRRVTPQKQDAAWEVLQSRHPVLYPLEHKEYACVGICPGDVMWLGQQGWPVGKNSFLMQGFLRYRHLLLGRREDGGYILGVPGNEDAQTKKNARAFGYGAFEKAGQEGFGYWCREIR